MVCVPSGKKKCLDFEFAKFSWNLPSPSNSAFLQSVDSALESWDSSGLESNNAHKSNTTLKSSGHNNSSDSRESHQDDRGQSGQRVAQILEQEV